MCVGGGTGVDNGGNYLIYNSGFNTTVSSLIISYKIQEAPSKPPRQRRQGDSNSGKTSRVNFKKGRT